MRMRLPACLPLLLISVLSAVTLPLPLCALDGSAILPTTPAVATEGADPHDAGSGPPAPGWRSPGGPDPHDAGSGPPAQDDVAPTADVASATVNGATATGVVPAPDDVAPATGIVSTTRDLASDATLLPATSAVASGAAFLTAVAGGAPIPAAGLLPMGSPRELRLGIAQAVEAALRQNHDLRIRRFETDLSGVEARRARTAFDPTVSAELSTADRLERQRSAGRLTDRAANGAEGSVAVRRTSPSGTRSTFGLIMSRDRSSTAGNLFDTRLGVDLVRPLRQGAGRTVNLIDVRQAELELKASRHELEGFVLSLVADVERKYWTFFLAVRELTIVEESKRLAQLQLQEVQKKIELGGVPESEQAAAEAELALREEAVIDARSAVETARLGLQHYYLGYVVPGCDRMAYKAGFAPHQLLDWDDGLWHETGRAPEHPSPGMIPLLSGWTGPD